jgi:membrane-associated phospholipid phosphatase
LRYFIGLPFLDFRSIRLKIGRLMPASSRRTWILLAVWTAAFIAALLIDRTTAEWVRRVHPLAKGSSLAWWLKLPGDFRFVLVVAAVLVLLQPRRWSRVIPVVLTGPLVGLVYLFLKWCVGRHRPVIEIAPFALHPFARGLHGLVGAEKGLSFPSGHAAMAFAAATCLAAIVRRGAAVFYLLAAGVAAERVLENAHYPSDVVAGAGFGVCCGLLSLRIATRCFGPSRAVSPDGEKVSIPTR